MICSPHLASPADLEFLGAFKSSNFDLKHFDHPAHLRLAYTLLCSMSAETAAHEIGSMIQNILINNKLDTKKFHVTLTCAWTKAVHHFMNQTSKCTSADDFISQNAQLLDPNILFNHYTEKQLYSATARKQYVAADISPIPEYG